MSKRKDAKSMKKSLRDYLTVAFHRKWLFLIPFVVTTGLLVVGIYCLPKKYESFALARRSDQSMSGLGQRIDKERTSLDVIREEVLGQAELRKALSRTEVLQVLGDPKMVQTLSKQWNKQESEEGEQYTMDQLQDSLTAVRKQITIKIIAQTPSDLTEIIKISVEDGDPIRSRVLANAICLNYKEYCQMVTKKQVENAITLPQEKLKEVSDELKKAEDALETFTTQQFSELPDEKRGTLKRHSDLRAEIERMESNVEDGERKIAEHAAALKEQPAKIKQKVGATENEDAAALKDRLKELETGLASLLQTYKENHPDVRRVRGEIAVVKAQLEQLQKPSDPSATEIEVENPLLHSMTEEHARMVEDQRTMKRELNSLKAERDLLGEQIKKFTPKAAAYNELLRNRDDLTIKYKNIHQLVEESQLRVAAEQAKLGTTVEVLEPALRGKQSFPPRPIVVLVIALLAGLAAGTGFVVMGEMSDHSFKTVEDAGEYLEPPILGTVGTIKPAVSNMRVWVTRVAVASLIVGLCLTVTLSYYYQEPLRAFYHRYLGW